MPEPVTLPSPGSNCTVTAVCLDERGRVCGYERHAPHLHGGTDLGWRGRRTLAVVSACSLLTAARCRELCEAAPVEGGGTLGGWLVRYEYPATDGFCRAASARPE